MDRDEVQTRAKSLALRVLNLTEALPNTTAGRELGRQVLRSATSVSANYRAARRARSRKEFISKVGVVAEEADETTHWLELIMEAELLPRQRVHELHREAEKLMRLFAKTRRSTNSNVRGKQADTTKTPNLIPPDSLAKNSKALRKDTPQ
jgi:four helix bundle protein